MAQDLTNVDREPDTGASPAIQTHRLRDALAVLFASKTAMVGLFIVLFWFSSALLAPYVTQYGPSDQDWKAPNQAPSQTHLLGTDELGRDLWSRLVYGARVVLVVLPVSPDLWIPGGTALWGVFVSLLVGACLGLVSGYRGGWVDEIIVAAIGASAVNVVIAIAIVGTPGVARLVRSLTLDIRTRDYVRPTDSEKNPCATNKDASSSNLAQGGSVGRPATTNCCRFCNKLFPDES